MGVSRLLLKGHRAGHDMSLDMKLDRRISPGPTAVPTTLIVLLKTLINGIAFKVMLLQHMMWNLHQLKANTIEQNTALKRLELRSAPNSSSSKLFLPPRRLSATLKYPDSAIKAAASVNVRVGMTLALGVSTCPKERRCIDTLRVRRLCGDTDGVRPCRASVQCQYLILRKPEGPCLTRWLQMVQIVLQRFQRVDCIGCRRKRMLCPALQWL